MAYLFSGVQVLILFVFPLASLDTVHAQSFTYTTTEHYESPSTTINLSFTQKFSDLGFIALDQSGSGRIPVLNMDQVFKKRNQIIFFKQGLKPSNSELKGELIAKAGGFLYHGVTVSNIPYAIFFEGFNKNQAKDILKKSGLARSPMFSFQIFPTAHASEVGCNTFPQNLQVLDQLKTTVNLSQINTIATSCAVSALRGATSGAKNLVTGTWEFTKTLFKNPEKLWREVKKSFAQITDLVKNFGPRITQLLQSMKTLDPEIATEIACSTISSIVIQALIGGGIAKAALLVSQKILSLDKIRESLSILSKLKNKGHKNTNSIVSGMVACTQ